MKTTSPWEVWTLMIRVSSSLMNDAAPRLRELGLEAKEFFLLAALDEHESPADLACELMLPKPTVTFLVKRMEAAGYVLRKLCPHDLRRFQLTLTDAGRQAMEQAREIFDEAFSQRLTRLSATQQAELARLLQRMSEG